jgi:outer membrane protein assembly factor BamB
VNTEERQLSDLLHRLTPEPPRTVTTEDIAFRMASQAGSGGRREPRPGRAPRRSGGRGLVPALAAVSVFAVAGLSAGVAVLVSHHGGPPASSGGSLTSTTSAPATASTSAPSTPLPASTGSATQPRAIEGGPWSAELIDHHSFAQDSLVGAGGSLFAIAPGSLARIDPATGVVAEVPIDSTVPGPPVVVGHTVWVVSYHLGGDVVLHGYNTATLAPVNTWTVVALGPLSGTAQGALAAGPDGTLYVAAGITVIAVDPSTGQQLHTYTLPNFLPQGSASSVAVSPNGSTLYVATGSFRLVKFDVAGGEITGESTMHLGNSAGNLVATSGGVWGTVGVGMSEWVWFAPGGNLSRAARVGQGAGAGLASVPSLSGGHIWIGGGQTLVCADPSTGEVLARANLPTDHGALEYFSSVAVVGSQAYAYYQDDASARSGVVTMTLPAACAS